MNVDKDIFKLAYGDGASVKESKESLEVCRAIGRAGRLVKAIASSDEEAKKKGFEVALKKIQRELYVKGVEAEPDELADLWRRVKEQKGGSKDTGATVNALKGLLGV